MRPGCLNSYTTAVSVYTPEASTSTCSTTPVRVASLRAFLDAVKPFHWALSVLF